jgi:hypothetical protein
MPITISYNDFITQTGNMPSGASQPYQYSGIASSISNLESDDRTIVFTNLPNGLRVVPALSTEPFDSIFVDIETYNDYVLMSGGGNNTWADSEQSYFQARYVSSAGFWALGATGNNSPGCILTGAGSGTSSILDISFEGINFQETTFNTTDVDMGDLYLERARKYIFDSSLGQFSSPVYFDQTSNDSWYPAEVVYYNGDGGHSLTISGTSYSATPSSLTLYVPFSGIVYWSGNALQSTESYNLQSFAPQPFSVLAEGYSWNATYANEIFSDYTILASNAGNTGTAIIQLNAAATNGEQFTDLITPLRKLYVLFNDNP